MPMKAYMRALALALIALWGTSTLEAWQDLRELLTRKLEYDDVIRLADEQIAKGQGDKKELMALEAYACFLKGKLLLASFTSCSELDALYYSCKESGISKGAYFSFFQGITSAARGQLGDATRQLGSFRKSSKDKAFSDVAAVWLGSIAEREGKAAERDNAWKGIDWKMYSFASERQAAYAVLGIKAGPAAQRPSSVTDPVLARNTLLTAGYLTELSREEKTKLLRLLQIAKPALSSKGKSKKEEVYFDVLTLLAAGKASLSIGKDLFAEVDRTLTADERAGKKFAALRNLMGQCAVLSGDYEGAIRALENDAAPTSPVYLGAAYSRSDNSAKAEQVWRTAEQNQDVRVQSELGFVYAMLGIRLDKAEELTGKFLAGAEDAQSPDQTLFYHHAFVKQKQGDALRAKEIYNQGYNYMRRGVLEAGANDPEYTVAYCAAIQKVDRTGMYDINDMLYKLRDKYDFGIQLHEAATGLATCLEIKLGK